MRRLYLLITIFIALTLSSCAQVTPPPAKSVPPVSEPQKHAKSKPVHKNVVHTNQYSNLKDPLTIQVYPKGGLSHPYKVIAKESVSTFNLGGIKRQDAAIHDALRDIAASLGGDAVINITKDETHATGTIVSFEKRVG